MKYKSKASKRSDKYKNSKRVLSQMRKDLQPLVDAANRLFSQLKAMGATGEDNAAIAEAEHSLTKSKERRSKEMFSVDDKVRFRDLRRESARLEKFLSSPQSSPEVYQFEKPAIDAMNKYGITFKGQHQRFIETGHRFGDDVDQERMKFAAKIYRELEETNANIYGAGGYGSDPLINLIYNSLENYDPYMSEDARDLLHMTAKQIGQDALTEHQNMIRMGFFNGSLANNIDVGVISKVREAKSVEDFLANNIDRDNLS